MAEITAFGDILTGDALAVLRTLPDQSVHCCVTSPPYWGLRDYGVSGQIGLESSPQEYVAALLPIFKEVWRVLRNDGTLWLNLGDSYIGYHGNKRAHGSVAPSDKDGYRENMRATSVGANGLKNKDMAGIPWRVAFALQDAGWYLRCDCIWAKPNPMPESVRDRPTRAHEYLFLFSKSERYPHGVSQLEHSIDLGLRIDCNQGLDARLIAADDVLASLLSRVHWLKSIRLACDHKSQMPAVERAVTSIRRHGGKKYNFSCYVLVKDVPDALERIEFLRSLGVDPFAQPYREPGSKSVPAQNLRRLARWCNHKAIFKTVPWPKYQGGAA